MRFVDRAKIAAPASLTDSDGAGAKELTKARKYYKGAFTKAYKFTAYKAFDVEISLRQLFHGKCAYCEAFFDGTQPTDVEHFRPKGQIEDCPTHPGYWWLAMKWENLLPSCIDCNRRRGQTTATKGMTLEQLEQRFLKAASDQLGKKDAFPTEDDKWVQSETESTSIERPLLIDPSKVEPNDHIGWETNSQSNALAIALPKSTHGVASIHCYGLNRLGLVQARTALLNDLRVRALRIRTALDIAGRKAETSPEWQDLVDFASDLITDMKQLARPERPFSALVSAFVAGFEAELRAQA